MTPSTAAELQPLSTDLAREIRELKRAGILNPQAVLNYAATHERSALYKCFEWDNRKAARAFRLSQAAELIIRVNITIDAPQRVRIRASVGEPERIVHHLEITPREAMLRSALEDLRRLQKKYGELSELAQVFEALDCVGVTKAA